MLSQKALEFLWKAFGPNSQTTVPIASLPTVAEIQAWIQAEAAKPKPEPTTNL